MNLAKTSFYNGIAVVVKMITMLGLNKILAIYVGPSGYAIIGQYQNLIQSLSAFSAGSLSNGITKYTAEYNASGRDRVKVWKTAGTISIILSIIVSLLLGIFSSYVSQIFFNEKIGEDIIIWLAFSFFFMMLNAFFLAILNGMKEVKIYVAINVAGSFIALFLTGFLAYYMGIKGALIALSINQSIVLIFTLFIFYRLPWFRFDYLLGKVNKDIAFGLGRFSIMALVSVIALPLGQIYVRSIISEAYSWKVAGYWEAMNRISSIAITIATTTLTLYYLPRLSEIGTKKEIKNEILHVAKLVIPITLISCVLVFFLRNTIVSILFTSDFLPMKDLFYGQLIGDFFKIVSWLFSFALLAKERWRAFIFCEIASVFIFISLNYSFLLMTNWQNICFAYAINYFLYFCMVFYCFYKTIYVKA